MNAFWAVLRSSQPGTYGHLEQWSILPREGALSACRTSILNINMASNGFRPALLFLSDNVHNLSHFQD
jgi:hypothetical protein